MEEVLCILVPFSVLSLGASIISAILAYRFKQKDKTLIRIKGRVVNVDAHTSAGFDAISGTERLTITVRYKLNGETEEKEHSFTVESTGNSVWGAFGRNSYLMPEDGKSPNLASYYKVGTLTDLGYFAGKPSVVYAINTQSSSAVSLFGKIRDVCGVLAVIGIFSVITYFVSPSFRKSGGDGGMKKEAAYELIEGGKGTLNN